ncbi:MAG: DUF885 domain-containing protein [Candidatus Aminicenantales bacterium]
MRNKALSLVILAFFLVHAGLIWSQENEEDQKMQKLLEEYLDAQWKFYPTSATVAGFHKYDNKLEDFSSKNIEKRLEALDEFNQALVTKVDRTKMSPDYQIDHEMMMDVLDLERLKHEMLIPWEYDPLFYNTILIHCVRPLLKKEFAPAEERAKNATERLKNLPKLLKQAKENLKTPAQISTETAIRQFPAILEIYRTEIPELIAQVPGESRTKLEAELAKVLPALEDFQSYLSNELRPKSTGNFRLGEAHARLIRLTLQNTIPIQELVERAKADVNNIRREMALVCLPFYRIMYPKINMEQVAAQRGEENAQQIFIKGVLDKIKGEHVSREEFISSIQTTAREIRDFLEEKQLIDLPEKEFRIETMPAEYRGITLTRLVCPGAYEPDGEYVLQVAPIPEEWTEDQANSFLEEFNNFLIYFYTIRKVYPGMLVPMSTCRQHPSMIRKLYPNMPLVEAWPVAFEEMLIYEGFGNYDLRLRLNQLKLRLRAVIDFIVEFNVHEGSWTKEEATAYMMRAGFQTEAEAERKWNRILLYPGDSAYTYVGMQEIIDMENEYKALKGDAFSQKEFLNALLNYGALPLRHLKKRILEQ